MGKNIFELKVFVLAMMKPYDQETGLLNILTKLSYRSPKDCKIALKIWFK